MSLNFGPKPMDNSGQIHEVLIGSLEANTQYMAQLEVSFPYYTNTQNITYSRIDIIGE